MCAGLFAKHLRAPVWKQNSIEFRRSFWISRASAVWKLGPFHHSSCLLDGGIFDLTFKYLVKSAKIETTSNHEPHESLQEIHCIPQLSIPTDSISIYIIDYDDSIPQNHCNFKEKAKLKITKQRSNHLVKLVLLAKSALPSVGKMELWFAMSKKQTVTDFGKPQVHQFTIR